MKLQTLCCVWMSPLTIFAGELKLRVVDAQTGDPLAARVELRAEDGSFPHDRIGLSAKKWPGIEAHGAFIREETTFDLPPGRTRIRASHGAQYMMGETAVEVPAEGLVEATLRLERLIDLRAKGWVGGDAHVHLMHGSREVETSYEEAARSSEAGGMDWVYFGQGYIGAGELDLQGFHQACAEVSSPGLRAAIGGERPKSLLGHNCLIGVPNPFLVPDDPPYYRAAREVHRQGGVLYYVHPIRYFNGKMWSGQWLDFPGNNMARELLFDAWAGPCFDGLSVLSDQPAHPTGHQLWFNLLNRGLFVPAMADTDTTFDRRYLNKSAPGFWMNFLHTPNGAVDDASLADAVRKGKTFATTGPLVEFLVDDAMPGATFPPDGKARTVTIRALHHFNVWTLETFDEKRGKPVAVERIELIRNGEIVERWEPRQTTAEISTTIRETESSWYAVRVFGTDDRWQVALTSPVYFAPQPRRNGDRVKNITVRGRIYDHQSGQPQEGRVSIRRGDALLAEFDARDRFLVKMPLDTELSVQTPGFRPLSHELIRDHGPIHRFLWYLESDDLGKPETLDAFDEIISTVDLEFPAGYRYPGSYLAAPLPGPAPFSNLKVRSAPPRPPHGTVSVAMLLTDAEAVAPGDTLNIALVFCHEGTDPDRASGVRLVCKARGYDPSRPSTYNALKEFGALEADWDDAEMAGAHFRYITGSLKVPHWVEPGPLGALALDLRARRYPQEPSFAGVLIPVKEETKRGLTVTATWPSMPISWHDHNYGIGLLRICGKGGREKQPRTDYRNLALDLTAGGQPFRVAPAIDAKGCADSDDAFYDEQFFDQILNRESNHMQPPPKRAQPEIEWPTDLPVVDATRG